MSTSPDEVILFIDPASHHFQQDRLFDLDKSPLIGDHLHAPYIHLREWFQKRGVRVFTADRLVRGEQRARKNIYVSMGVQTNYLALSQQPDVALSGFFAMECPIVEPRLYRELGRAQHHFKRVFSWSDGHSLEQFVGGPLQCERFFWPQSFNDVHEAIWAKDDREFLVMVNANKLPRLYWQELYTERMRAVAWFSARQAINLYGKGWNEPSKRMGKTWLPWTLRGWLEALDARWQKIRPDPLMTAARQVYRGPAASKAEALGNHTFALCYENMILKGWITEKIFDCFFAGTIPIYWGEPEIEKYVPPTCFIDRRKFKDYADLYAFLKALTPDKIRAYKENARAFLASPTYFPFTKEAFTGHFRRMVETDASIRLPD